MRNHSYIKLKSLIFKAVKAKEILRIRVLHNLKRYFSVNQFYLGLNNQCTKGDSNRKCFFASGRRFKVLSVGILKIISRNQLSQFNLAIISVKLSAERDKEIIGYFDPAGLPYIHEAPPSATFLWKKR